MTIKSASWLRHYVCCVQSKWFNEVPLEQMGQGLFTSHELSLDGNPRTILNNVFGFPSYRPGQEKAIFCDSSSLLSAMTTQTYPERSEITQLVVLSYDGSYFQRYLGMPGNRHICLVIDH